MLQIEYDVVGECVCGRNDISAPAVMLESGVIVCSFCSKRRPTKRAGDICHESASSNHVWQVVNGVQICIACGKCA